MAKKPKSTTKNTVPEQLAKLGDIFRQRNAVYGDSIRQVGSILFGMFPGGLAIKTDDDWNRLCLLLHVVDKVVRYANNFERGGHSDSLDDIAVYSQILRMIDREYVSDSTGL